MSIARLAVVAALVSAPVSLANAEGLSYNFIDARYVNVDLDDTDVDADGFGIGGSVKVADQLYLKASYSALETDEFTVFTTTGSIEFDQLAAGLGFIAPLGPSTHFNAEAGWIRVDGEGSGGFSGASADAEDGFDLGAGVRHLFTPMFEIGLGLDYVEIDDEDDTIFGANGLVHFTPMFSAVAAFSTGSDDKTWSVGGRFNFGS